MVMKTKLLLIAIILFSTSSFISNRPVTVFMIGDSTMANRSIQNKNNDACRLPDRQSDCR